MTFLATFLDLIPMAIGMGRGSEANVPLARAVVGGLLTSTCLTLFVVPILYTLLLGEKRGDEEAVEAEIEAELSDEPPPRRLPALAVASAPRLATAGAPGHANGLAEVVQVQGDGPN
jgi:hypothetical protein